MVAPQVLLEWRGGEQTAAFDLHLRLCHAAHTALHVTPSGAGWFSNVWGWGCDHNLTDNSDNTPRLSADTKWLGAISGLRVESSTGPTCVSPDDVSTAAVARIRHSRAPLCKPSA